MKIFAALLVALPIAASAQYEPQSGPPGRVAPDEPAADADYGYTRRSPWYIGFGLGTGDGHLKGQGRTLSFDSWHGGVNSPTNLVLNFKVGLTLTPNILVGFDLTGINSQLDEGGLTTTIGITNSDAMLTWFPRGEGFFLRGGAGFSRLTLDAGAGSQSWDGYNVLVGGGYAFWMGRAFNLTLNADYTFQNYGSSTTAPEGSDFFALWVGFDWY